MPRRASLSLDLLETFVLLVEHAGDAGAAARALQINQPSMSKRLRYLQLRSRVLPRPWVTRDGKHWKLTAEGERALPAVRDLLARYDRLRDFVTSEAAVSNEVRFACGNRSAQGLVRGALRQFRREFPNVTLRVATLRGSRRVDGVASGSLDLAIVTFEVERITRLARRSLIVRDLASDPLVLACSARSPCAERLERTADGKLSLELLPVFPLIVPPAASPLRRRLARTREAQGIRRPLDIRMELGSTSAIVTYVQDGLGVGLLPQSSLPASHSLVVRRISADEFPPIVSRLICRPKFDRPAERDLSAPAEKLWQCLTER